jgi:hypothetical protein
MDPVWTQAWDIYSSEQRDALILCTWICDGPRIAPPIGPVMDPLEGGVPIPCACANTMRGASQAYRHWIQRTLLTRSAYPPPAQYYAAGSCRVSPSSHIHSFAWVLSLLLHVC